MEKGIGQEGLDNEESLNLGNKENYISVLSNVLMHSEIPWGSA